MTLTISREAIWLMAVCLADAILTIILVGFGVAHEANPVMAYWIQRSFLAFFLIKMATVVPAVVVAEAYRRYNPVFVKRVLQAGTVAYVGIYVVATLLVNTRC